MAFLSFLPLNIFTFLCLGLVVVASHAAAVEPSQVYWQTVLPNTPMPKSLSDLVHPPEWVNMVAGKGKPISFGDNKKVIVVLEYRKAGQVDSDRAHVGDNKGIALELVIKYKPNGQKLLQDPNLKATKHVDSAHVGDKKEVVVTLSYKKPNSVEKTLQDNPDFKATAAALFFLENKLHKGAQMKLFFTKSTTPLATFLPLELAKEIPFSSKKLPEILKFFSLKPSSREAEMMKKTIDDCEVEANVGEDKYCASSLESMIDFATSKLGKKVNAFSMEANRESDEIQEYTIVGVKKMGGGKSIACHGQNYAYALFYCHSIASTEAYSISLMGKNGARAKAVGVCHTDTKDWDADYIGFQVLNVKPGTVPICHLLPQGHVLWVPSV